MNPDTKHSLVRRDEMMNAVLNVGGQAIDLSEYATTGLLAVGVGPAAAERPTSGS